MNSPDHPPDNPSDRPRWRGGRPRLSDERRKGEALPPVRLTPAERAAVEALAQAVHLSVSEWVRRALLGRRMPASVPIVNREAWKKLGPLAANLNQAVKAIHRGKADPLPLDLLEQLRREVQALREELRGRDPEGQ